MQHQHEWNPEEQQPGVVYYADEFVESPQPPISKKLVSSNNIEKCAMEFLEGFVAVHNGLRLFGDKTGTVVMEDLRGIKGKVAVVAGGGAGHEPYAAGFVGKGMLTAAMMGTIFHTPCNKHVEAVFNYLSKFKPAGILCIILNNPGQRLNFGLGIEHARRAGLKVGAFVFGDDSVNTAGRVARRRGLGGSLVIMKIAGAMAEDGFSMAEIVDELDVVANMIATLGVALYSLSLPGQQPEYVIDEDKLELAPGFEGERGIKQLKMERVEKVVGKMFGHMMDYRNLAGIHLDKNQDVVVMVNNLGTMSFMEELIVVRQAISDLEKSSIRVIRAFHGRLMTALDMNGFQLTLFKLSMKEDRKQRWLEWLDAPTEAATWPTVIMSDTSEHRFSPDPIPAPPLSELEDVLLTDINIIELSQEAQAMFTRVIRSVEKAIAKREKALNEMDAIFGNGDTGTNLRLGLIAMMDGMISHTVDLKHPRVALAQFSDICASYMVGASGGLYSLLFSAGGRAIHSYEKKLLKKEPGRNLKMNPYDPSLHLSLWVDALEAGTMCIVEYGGARPGERTLLDALLPALKVLRMWQGDDRVVRRVLNAASRAASKGAAKTARMTARMNTSNPGYMKIGSAVHPDPGAAAVSIWLGALRDAVAISLPNLPGYDSHESVTSDD